MANLHDSSIEIKKRFSVDNHSNFQFRANNAIKQLINYDTDKIKIRNSYRTSSIDRSSLNLAISRPKTNFEKVVENLKEIMLKFKLEGKDKYKEKTEQVIYELISNTIYSYDDNNGENSEEILFLEQYTSGYILYDKQNERSDVKSYKSITIEFKNKIQDSKSHLIDIEQFGVNFDVFSYAEAHGRRSMYMNISNSALTYREVNKLLKTSYLHDHLEKLWEGYTTQPDAFYHNDFHSADVLQGMVDILSRGKLGVVAELDELDCLSSLYSALIHDFKHPGYNNGFLINSKSDISIAYNDKSCLESYHLAEAFGLIKNPSLDIFVKLSINDFKYLRKRVIEAVLATDMANHSKLIGVMTTRISMVPDDKCSSSCIQARNQELNKFDIQQDFINFMLHAIDIGHAAKPFKLELLWADLVTQEFHNQGDKEKELGLPISFLCDRKSTNLPASQMGFIEGIVLPAFILAYAFLPEIEEYIDLIKKSKAEWEKLNK